MAAQTIAVISLISFLSLTYGQNDQPFRTKAIDGNSGLYFEDTGKVIFYSQEWKIVSNVNLTDYHNELSNIRYVVYNIRNYCEELKSIEAEKNASVKGNEGCGPALLKLNFLMADIDTNDNQWLGKDKRAKRNAFSDLVSDDWPSDHSTFLNEFTNMSAHGVETSASATEQTSYVMSTLNSVRKLSKNNESIDAYIANQLSQVHNTLVAARNGTVNAVRLFQLRTTIPDIISYQLLILTNFASKQKQYLNLMSLVGVANAPVLTILPTSILLSELNNIRSIVSEKGLGFPVQLASENVHLLLHILTPEISRCGDQVFITFKIPLIAKLTGNYFTLFKITSALNNVSGTIYSFIVPNHEVIAIDAHKEHYVVLSVDDLKKCRQVGNGTATLCKQTSPPMSVRTSTECEIMILLKYRIPKWCDERYIRNYADIFIRVMQPNTWLVTMPKSSKIRYLCEGKKIYETTSQINGLLTIDSNCQFFTDDVVIAGDTTLPKRSVREHLVGHFEKEQQLNETSGLESNEHFTSNHIAQVIGFGESEYLLRISCSRSDARIMKSVTELEDKVATRFGPEISLVIDAFIICCTVLFSACFLIATCKAIEDYRAWKLKHPSTITPKPSAPAATTKTFISTA
ncbi:uncharacterized protein LOC119069623 [Bradysia coprophila]|uniref:uncharacterized protein LOC119069623 n=1 Tax=Bradysia coprophila TaxID=38358 RepID=UPI00187D9B47|nr:uncharacterized protein LOC119069623 [Bradysia coprophila]